MPSETSRHSYDLALRFVLGAVIGYLIISFASETIWLRILASVTVGIDVIAAYYYRRAMEE